ncbi:MAG: hypothetical protein GJT30_14140 [Geobacter sp.]|nr:hypothetical protein [Geobacter sp.]
MRMPRIFPIIFVLLALTVDSAPALDLTGQDSGRSVTVPVGEVVSITLGGNPTTGYAWELTEVDRAVLAPDPEPAYVADSALSGAGGKYTFRFSARAAGSTAVQLVYRRPWEKGLPPLERFDLQVVVVAESRTTSAVYHSADGKTARATFDLDRDLVNVTLPDGQMVTLPAAPSASGARYSNGNETFWEHQGAARFFKGDTVIFEGRVEPVE